jgi:replication-associated recombination protein RarA
MSLFPSRLIITSSSESSENKIKELLEELHHQLSNDPDLFILNDYTIAAVRSLKKFLSQKPFNHDTKVVYLPQVQNLNIESQNALLKTLEEPGENNYLLLTTSNPSLLLPTILSRCQKIRLNYTENKEKTVLWPITGNPKKDLDFATTITMDKTQIKSLLLSQLNQYHQNFILDPKPVTAKIIKKLIKAVNLIDSNVDPKSALDYFFLK